MRTGSYPCRRPRPFHFSAALRLAVAALAVRERALHLQAAKRYLLRFSRENR